MFLTERTKYSEQNLHCSQGLRGRFPNFPERVFLRRMTAKIFRTLYR